MKFEDLREFIQKIDEIGELTRVDGVDPKTEIGPISEIVAWNPDPPAILFDNVKGYPPGFRIMVWPFSSTKRAQLIYGFPDGLGSKELVMWWKDRLENYAPIPPKEVSSGPVMENVQKGTDVNLLGFPAPLWHKEDGGPYLATGSVAIVRDPDTGGLNLGSYRGMLYDNNTLGHHMAAGHDGQVIRDKYHQRGEPCPIVVSLGNDPSFLVAANESLPYDMSEYDYGGFIRGAPYQVIKGPETGIPFPATAEVVIEGEIPPPAVEPKRTEGPWGEGPGYYSSGYLQPVIKPKAVYFRNDPIITGVPTYRFRQQGVRGFTGLAWQWHRLEKSGLPGIKGVGRAGRFQVISIKQYYSGHALRVADLVMAGLNDRPPRYLVIVDDDIDPFSRRQVDWAMYSRVDPATQVHIQKERWCSAVNPAGLTTEKRKIEDYSLGTLIIDACKPFRWREDWHTMFKTHELEEERRKEIAGKWKSILGELITKTMPKQ
jgi:4-hydroxy-3-polyprenylbenzoate decarboxylase